MVVDSAIHVHSALGPGLLASVYETCLVHALLERGLHVDRQLHMPVRFRGLLLRTGLRLDPLVDRSVVVELKAVEALNDLHRAQLPTYLRLSNRRVGLLLNFNTIRLRDGIVRVIR